MRAVDVMTTDVLTVTPDTSVGDLARLLLERRISGAPVIDGHGHVIGIVSEGDLLHRVEAGTTVRRSWWLELLTDNAKLASDYVKSHARKVGDLMTRDVVTVEEKTPLVDVARLLEKHRIKRVPVVHKGKLVGIISRANLLQGLASEDPGSSETTVGDMTIRASLIAELKAQNWAPLWAKNIIVRKGTVHLWGLVQSEEERKALLVAAGNIPGVKAVRDHLTIAPPPMMPL